MPNTLRQIRKSAASALVTKWRILKLFAAHTFRWQGLGEISLTRTDGILHQGGIQVIGISAPGCHRIRIQGQPSLPGNTDVLRIWLTEPVETITVQFHGVFETRVAKLILSCDRIDIQQPESPRLTLPAAEQTNLPQARVTIPKPMAASHPTPQVRMPSVRMAWPSFTIPRQSQPPH